MKFERRFSPGFMIKHIVLFKFKEGIGWDDPRALAAEKAVEALGEQIPELKSWFTGRNISDRPIAYDYALVADVADREALQRYLVNSDHVAGVKKWAEISAWNIADIEY